MNCPECNMNLSGAAKSCPDCGCPSEANVIESAKGSVSGRALFSIVLLAIGSAFILLYLAL